MSHASDDYALLDCGNGRRLERFGGVVVSRPAPAAVRRRGLASSVWDSAELVFDRAGGWRGAAPEGWRVRFGGVVMGLRPMGAGQIGVFPEHAPVAGKILSRARAGDAPPRVLNLFAHTGLATLMFAAAGCAVAHVDGAAAAVKQARENALLSGLSDAPVRWLVDDVPGFMRREARRGRGYDIVLADPPAFGRGGKSGGEWKLSRDLPGLVSLAETLLCAGGVFALTCHSEGWGEGRLTDAVRGNSGLKNIEEEKLALAAEGGKGLPGGQIVFAKK